MDKKQLLSKLYHINLQLIDQLYCRLDKEWEDISIINELSDDRLNETYRDMLWLNNEINGLLEHFDDDDGICINNKTI
jgi:hypothetical protein